MILKLKLATSLRAKLLVLAILVVLGALPAQAQTTTAYMWVTANGTSGPLYGAFPDEVSAVLALDSALESPVGTSCSATYPERIYYAPLGDWYTLDQAVERTYGLVFEYYWDKCVPNGPEDAPGTDAVLRQVAIKASNLQTSLVDPVPSEVTAGGVAADANGLSSITKTVVGAATDGTAEIVVRIAAPSAGTAIQLSLADESQRLAAAGSGDALGYLTTLLPSDGTASTANGQPITVTAVSLAGGGAMAFALYHPPLDFVRDGNANDPSLAARNVYVELSAGGSVQSEQTVELVRPPVVFIHGIWGSGDDGDQILSSIMSVGSGLTTYSLSYDGSVTIASSAPSYGSNLRVSGSSLGFSYAASIVLPELNDAIADYHTNNTLGQPIAVAQADIVAHSMGGDVARTLPAMGDFTQSVNYEKGLIHKLITIGTPHLGSPLALDLLDGSNSCVAWVLRKKHRYAFSSVTLSSGASYTGGVNDLQGGLSGSPLSLALSAIQPETTSIKTSIPTAMIAASMSSTQLTAVDTSSNAKDIRVICGKFASDPLANALTSVSWPTIVGTESDAIVPVNSQLAGTANTEFPLAEEVHSPGTEDLGFAGPSELDDTAVIPIEVLTLLNTPIDQSVFTSLP